jgi:hypothetical protein
LLHLKYCRLLSGGIADGVARESESETAAGKHTGSRPARTPRNPQPGRRLALVERHRFRAGLHGFWLWEFGSFCCGMPTPASAESSTTEKMARSGLPGGYPLTQAVGVIKRKVPRIRRRP